MKYNSIRDIPTNVLKAYRKLGPSNSGTTISMSVNGQDAVTITQEMVKNIDAELKRRKSTPGGAR